MSETHRTPLQRTVEEQGWYARKTCRDTGRHGQGDPDRAKDRDALPPRRDADMQPPEMEAALPCCGHKPLFRVARGELDEPHIYCRNLRHGLVVSAAFRRIAEAVEAWNQEIAGEAKTLNRPTAEGVVVCATGTEEDVVHGERLHCGRRNLRDPVGQSE